jgi:hypothetical protein
MSEAAWQRRLAQIARDAPARHAARFTTDAALNSSQQDAARREQESWSLLCQALMLSNEFIYVR